jgi:hypothetical protein
MEWFEKVFIFLVLLSIYRNYWVFKNRNKLLMSDINIYKKLVSYYQMYWKVWIWDINKFKKENYERN